MNVMSDGLRVPCYKFFLPGMLMIVNDPPIASNLFLYLAPKRNLECMEGAKIKNFKIALFHGLSR